MYRVVLLNLLNEYETFYIKIIIVSYLVVEILKLPWKSEYFNLQKSQISYRRKKPIILLCWLSSSSDDQRPTNILLILLYQKCK